MAKHLKSDSSADSLRIEYSSAEKPLNIANWSRGYCA